jgi:hypothetical protein
MLHPAVASACGTARGARSHRPGILLALLIALLAVISFTTTAGAQEPATGQITGVVSDSTTGQPLSSVSVSVAGTRLGDLTDAQGRYTIDRVPAGTLTLQTRRIGY